MARTTNKLGGQKEGLIEFTEKELLYPVWAILSPIVGTPKILSPPVFFGIGTAFTGGGM